jgi:hypothetical protein
LRRLAVLLAVVLTIGGGGAALAQPAPPGPAGDEREVTRALVHLIRDVNAVKSSLRRYARERAAATGQPVCPVRRGNCLSSAIEAANAAGGDRAARAVLHDAVEDYLIKAGRADLAIAHGDDGWRPYLEELYGGRFSPPLGAGELTPALGVQPEGTIAVVHASGDRARHLLAAVTGPGGGVHFIDANKVDRETDAYGSAWAPRELSAHFDTFRWIDTGRRADLGSLTAVAAPAAAVLPAPAATPAETPAEPVIAAPPAPQPPVAEEATGLFPVAVPFQGLGGALAPVLAPVTLPGPGG